MLSRDTAIHLSAVLVALAVLTIASLAAPSLDDPLYLGALLVFHAILFGGAHAYLAWRGEGGMVPVDSRVRFVVALLVVLGLGAIGALGPDGEVAGVSFDAILFAIGGLVALAYFLTEARAGYLESRPT